jgi:hypothetical protein
MLGKPMKKLATMIAAASLAIAAPAFACPHDEEAPKTAEKKEEKAPADKAKEQPKKTTETAKAKEQPKKDAPKKPEKVSQK